MDTYIGCKIIKAEPMCQCYFLTQVKGEKLPDGFVCREGYKVVYPDGYTSWSPQEVFESAYRRITLDEFDLVKEICL